MTLDPQCFLSDGTFLAGTPCDDGDSTTFWDACVATELACAGFQVDMACLKYGIPVDVNDECNDKDTSTVEDVCDFRDGRKFTCKGLRAHELGANPLYKMCRDSEGHPLHDGTRCDDGHVFTHLEECQAGHCVWHHLDPQCAGDNGEFALDALCDDGDPETFFDRCMVDSASGDGVCAGLVIDDECKDESGKPVSSGSPCDDGNPSTIGDACLSSDTGGAGSGGRRYQCTGLPVDSTCYDFLANQFLASGTPCQHGNRDVVNAQCDGNGLCDGVIVDPACRTTNRSAPYYPMVEEFTACDDGKDYTVEDVCVVDYYNLNVAGRTMTCKGCNTKTENCGRDESENQCGTNMVGNSSNWSFKDAAGWDTMTNGTGAIVDDQMNARYQIIDLTKFYDTNFLDTSPEIFIKETIAGDVTQSHVYFIQVNILDNDQQVIHSVSLGSLGNPVAFQAHLYESYANVFQSFESEVYGSEHFETEFFDSELSDDYSYQDGTSKSQGVMLVRKRLKNYPIGARYLNISQGGKGATKGPVFMNTTAVINGCCHEHPLACGLNAFCNDKADGFECVCMPPFMGQACNRTSACYKKDGTSPCGLHGTCTEANFDYICACDPGWTGRNCNADIDECTDPYICGTSGTCVNNEGSYECVCPVGNQGKNCALEEWTMGQTRLGYLAFQDGGDDRLVIQGDGSVWVEGSLLGDFKYVFGGSGGKCKQAVAGDLRVPQHTIADWGICESDTGNLVFSKGSEEVMHIQPDGRMYSHSIKSYYKQGGRATLEPGRCNPKYTKTFFLWQICVTARNYLGFFLHNEPVILVHHQSQVWSAYGGGGYFLRNAQTLKTDPMLRMLPWDANTCKSRSVNLVRNMFLNDMSPSDRTSGGWKKIGSDDCSWFSFGQYTSAGATFCSRTQVIDLSQENDLAAIPPIYVQDDVYAHSVEKGIATKATDHYYIQFELLDYNKKTVAKYGVGNATHMVKLEGFGGSHNHHAHISHTFQGPD